MRGCCETSVCKLQYLVKTNKFESEVSFFILPFSSDFDVGSRALSLFRWREHFFLSIHRQHIRKIQKKTRKRDREYFYSFSIGEHVSILLGQALGRVFVLKTRLRLYEGISWTVFMFTCVREKNMSFRLPERDTLKIDKINIKYLFRKFAIHEHKYIRWMSS